MEYLLVEINLSMTYSGFHQYSCAGDTSRVAGIFKQNFKVKCESRNTKAITWQYSSINNIIYESMLILLRENHS
jgi:hypothetical protein